MGNPNAKPLTPKQRRAILEYLPHLSDVRCAALLQVSDRTIAADRKHLPPIPPILEIPAILLQKALNNVSYIEQARDEALGEPVKLANAVALALQCAHKIACDPRLGGMDQDTVKDALVAMAAMYGKTIKED